MKGNDSQQELELSTPYNRALDSEEGDGLSTFEAASRNRLASEKVVHRFTLAIREIPYGTPQSPSDKNGTIPVRSLDGTSYLPQLLRQHYGILEEEWLQFRYKVLSCVKEIQTATEVRNFFLGTALLGYVLVLPFSQSYKRTTDEHNEGELIYVTSKWGTILVNVLLGYVVFAGVAGTLGFVFLVGLIGRRINWICRDSNFAGGALLVRFCQSEIAKTGENRVSDEHHCWIEAYVPVSSPLV
uniref:Uncharacterized protein n=1 Tax=Leptocylindrus danicus TaxID=163516 RepID=A0A7S2LH69_9STRA